MQSVYFLADGCRYEIFAHSNFKPKDFSLCLEWLELAVEQHDVSVLVEQAWFGVVRVDLHSELREERLQNKSKLMDCVYVRLHTLTRDLSTRVPGLK